MTLDRLESLSNAVIGLLISVAAVHVLWPMFGWTVSPPQSAGVATVFFALSLIRHHALRLVFRRMDQRERTE